MTDITTDRMPRPRGFLSTIAIVLVGALCLHTLSVEGSRPLRVAAEPTPVAVVDVARVLEQIDERSEWDIRIEALRGSIQREAAKRREAMDKRLKESEQATNPEDRQKIRDEVALMQLRLEQWGALKTAEVDREESLKWRSIYRNLRRESQRVAEAEGYEMVMVDDSVGDVQTMTQSKVPLQQQVLEQITNRRILFAANTIDITDQVIVRMNNAANTTP
jgi:Skp family chaperone for outer membrane proteins